MAPDPNDIRDKTLRGNFDRVEEEEEEDDVELDLDFLGPGIANSEMESAAEAARLKVGAKKLTAEALAEMLRPTGASRYVSGGGDDEDEDDSPRRQRAVADTDDEELGSLGSLDAPLWNVVAAAPVPPDRPDGFPLPSKWVTTDVATSALSV